MKFDEAMLAALRQDVGATMSQKRLTHTLEVEKMAVRLGRLYAPDKLDILGAAALLHDITKEKSFEEHIAILKDNGYDVTDDDINSPKTLHAKTAPYEIKKSYPEFATERVLNAIRNHTTGRADMTLFDAIIYLADYIEETRTFEDCVYLRNVFWSAEPQKMDKAERERHLWKTVILSLDMTVKDIESANGYISVDTLLAREAIAKKLS